MAPTLMCLAALVAADPRLDVDRAFPSTPTPFHTKQVSTTPQTVTSSYRSENTIGVETEDEEVRTPFGPVDLVLRGQTPTYAQPGGAGYQGQPELIPPPGGEIPNFPAQPGIGIQTQPGPGFQTFPPQPMVTRFYATYENVFLTPYFSQNTSVHSMGPGPAASVTQFDWDLEYSPRVEIGMVSPDGTGWRARYWHFEHSTNDSLTAAPGSAITIAPDPITGAGVGNIAPATTLNATHSLRMSVLDAEFLKKSVAGDGGLDLSFGLRYARMDQWLRGRAATPAGAITANNALHHDFEGFGPTIAAEYRRPLWNSNWGAFGNARAAFMYGDSNYRFDQRVGGALAASSRNTSDSGLQTAFEFQVGLDYRRPVFYGHEFLFRVALESQYWPDAGSASADMTGLGSASPQETDLGFFGFTIATGLTW